MLQRIQTIYLLVSFIIISLTLFFPFFEFNSNEANEYIFNSMTIEQVSANSVNVISNVFPLLILISIILLLNIFAIFLFKKRLLQLRTTYLIIILLIGFYGLLAFYRFVMLDFEVLSTDYSFTLIIPIISAILVFIANRKIKRDIDLLRSADRIR